MNLLCQPKIQRRSASVTIAVQCNHKDFSFDMRTRFLEFDPWSLRPYRHLLTSLLQLHHCECIVGACSPLTGVSSSATAPILSQRLADVDRHAAGLAKSASSLLLLQPVLQGPAAQAFLILLGAISQRKRPSVVEAYGSFYRELVLSGCSSWQEHLLEEVRNCYSVHARDCQVPHPLSECSEPVFVFRGAGSLMWTSTACRLRAWGILAHGPMGSACGWTQEKSKRGADSKHTSTKRAGQRSPSRCS